MSERPRLQFWFELSGVVPLAVYTLVHVGSYAGALFGCSSFGVASPAPLWLALEIALVWLPLAFHAGYGLRLSSTSLPAEPAERQRGLLLRVSGCVALPLTLAHALWLKLPLWRGTRAPEDLAQMLAAGLSTTVRGVPLSAGLHFVGLAAVALHLGLGLGSFAEKRGVLARIPARRAAGLFSVLLFLVGSATVVELATGSALPRFVR
jgi:succinate dehydrogenase / fumarate reductase cytochrome b subunit